jgi:hypothetical protein
MPNKPDPGKNRVFTVTCVLNNVIFMTEKTWQQHSIPRHSEQDLVGDIEEIKATLQNATRVRRSTDPKIGKDTGIYERMIDGTNLLMRVPVLFDFPTYHEGQHLGKVTSAFILGQGQWDSGQVGEIFWVSNQGEKDKP